MCFSCGFLVSVLWMVFVPPFVPTLDLLPSFRFSPRSSFRSSVHFARFVLRFALRSVLRFVCSFWRIVEAVRAAVFGAGRSACRLAWRDDGAFVVCAVFVSSCSWALAVVSGFPFSSFGVSSVLLVSAGREVRCLSCECRSGRMRLRCGVVSFLVPYGRPVSSGVSVSSRLFSPLPFSSLPSFLFVFVSSGVSCGGVFGVGSLERGDVAVCGCWMWRGGVACRGSCRGRFGNAVSCGGVCRERDERRDEWRDEGRDGGCAVFVSSSWRFVGRWRRRG